MRVESFYAGHPRLQWHMYDLRSRGFSEFSPHEQMVFWQLDPLCLHFGIFEGDKALAFASVADYSGYPETHSGLDELLDGYSPSLRIKGVHRLASEGNVAALRMLLQVIEQETRDCDVFVGFTAPSVNNPNDTSRHKLGLKYCRLAGADHIGVRVAGGIEQHYFAKWNF